MKEIMEKAMPALVWSVAAVLLVGLAGCSTAYVARPLPFKSPSAYANVTQVADAQVASEAFADADKAREAFGFDIRAAGMLPVQVVFDNQGSHPLEINVGQTFLEDEAGNIWPILDRDTAYARATKYAQTKEVFTEGAYGAFLGTAAGAIIGAAVGIVTGDNVAVTTGKGAAVGAAAGATLGGVKGYTSGDARRIVVEDLQRKTLQQKPVEPRSLSFGFLFFPGEAPSAVQLRLQLKETDSGSRAPAQDEAVSRCMSCAARCPNTGPGGAEHPSFSLKKKPPGIARAAF